MLLEVGDGVVVDMAILRKDRIQGHASSVLWIDEDVAAREVDAFGEVACVVVALWSVASNYRDRDVSV